MGKEGEKKIVLIRGGRSTIGRASYKYSHYEVGRGKKFEIYFIHKEDLSLPDRNTSILERNTESRITLSEKNR